MCAAVLSHRQALCARANLPHPEPRQVLVTHQVEFLPRCDTVAIMDEGRCVYYGELDAPAWMQHDT